MRRLTSLFVMALVAVWPLSGRRAIEPHPLATLTAWDPDTSSGLQAWVFDSAKDARSAQKPRRRSRTAAGRPARATPRRGRASWSARSA